ncbi:MAG: S1 RNA-binding domain-containing protein [Candidatus Daviesbacteria bacterium]|nr:S1 RNA-binding domain-containing protein [Candidatus Daviesbacteria bacterium]
MQSKSKPGQSDTPKQSLGSSGPQTMEELLASLQSKILTLQFGQEIEGIVVAVLDKEILLDLSTKSEGVLPRRELSPEQQQNLKPGDSLKCFVALVENESGQTTLSMHKQVRVRPSFGRGRGGKAIDWSRFISAMNQKSKITGTVTEINKGGLILEVDAIRGFLPGSQIGIDALGKLMGKNADVVGQQLTATVIEIDQNNNRLIFSQKGQVDEELKTKLASFKSGAKVKGKISAVYPFGVLVDVEGNFGMVFPQDITWEKTEDPTATVAVGTEVEAQVTSVEPEYGRIGLSLKQLKEDPFAKIAENFETDDVVSATVSAISAQGVSFILKDNVEGFMASNKVPAGTIYEANQKVSCLVDSVDSSRRRVNLVPMLTSTEGLIYK